MADQSEGDSFNSDFQLEQHKQHQIQRDASDERNNSAVASVEPKAITNIYYDCLERIFDFLDLKSLLNVARTCKRLQIAAAAKFGDDYGNKHNFMLEKRRIHEQREIREYKYYSIDIYFPIALPFLRCFGSKISNLLVVNHNHTSISNTQRDHLSQYINRYCADTLSYIYFYGNWKISKQNFPMPFVNVVEVEIGDFDAGYNSNLPDIRNCFPNIRRLEMHGDFGDDSSSILQDNHDIVSFPHLRHLVLGRFTIENAVKLLHANRQLQHLFLYSQTEITFGQLLHMLDGNSSILKFEMNSTLSNVNEVDLNRFSMQCPMIEELSFTYSLTSFTSDQAFILIYKLSSLKRFEFVMNNRSEYDHLVRRLDKAGKHSFHFNNNVVTYLSKRPRQQ